MPIPQRLIAVIRAFVEAQSWDESREIVERHPELLTADVAAALETFARNAERIGNEDMAHTFRVHRALLRRCAEVGTVAAFLELDAPAGGPPPGPGLEIPREVLTGELLALSREIWIRRRKELDHPLADLDPPTGAAGRDGITELLDERDQLVVVRCVVHRHSRGAVVGVRASPVVLRIPEDALVVGLADGSGGVLGRRARHPGREP